MCPDRAAVRHHGEDADVPDLYRGLTGAASDLLPGGLAGGFYKGTSPAHRQHRRELRLFMCATASAQQVVRKVVGLDRQQAKLQVS